MSGGPSGIGSSGAPVIIAADNTPTKVVPENPGGKTVPNQDKAVYDRVAGGAPADPKQPSLISTNEEPMDVVQKTLIPETLPLEGESDEAMDNFGTPVGETEDPRLLPRDQAQQTAEAENGSPVNVAPRKVRTMIVKPDGTLVAQDVPVAAEPPARTAAATPDNAAVASNGLAAPAAGQPSEAMPAVIATSHVPAVAPPAAANTPASVPSVDGPQITAPVPSARPATPAVNVAARTPVAPAPVATAAPVQAAAISQTATSEGGYFIQIASLPSEAEAQRSYQSLTGKFGTVIAGRGMDIKRADIEGKGTFYRVRIPAGGKAEAATLCERYRQAGGSCIVAR
jgi:hypothetical protein